MKPDLLETQVRIPPQAIQLISRNRLTDRLEESVFSAKLVLVTAPAGYGKTTLLAQWANASRFKVGWLSLSEAENDHERFTRYFYRALENVLPHIRESHAGILLQGSQPDVKQVFTALINFADSTDEQAAIVLDDYHLIENPEIHQSVAYLVDQLPASFQIILSTRAEPPLPLARYRARGQMVEIRTDELQFRLEETAIFLHEAMGLSLARDVIDNLNAELEGWAAGLRLAGLSLRRGSRDAGEHADSRRPLISGKNRFIADYLSQDVLHSISDDMRRFLLHTSILDRLCAPLCNAVTEQPDGQAMLQTLERENVFLVALDDQREWFRYHNLFADFLRKELDRDYPGAVSELHRRAALWFLEQRMPEQAYQHALAAGDLPVMANLFNRYANAMLYAGAYNDLKRWLDGLPAEWYSLYPSLGLARAGYMAFTGAFAACLRIVDEVEQSLTPPENEEARYQLARVKAVRCFIACIENDMPQAESLAGEALRELPDTDEGYLPGIYSALGDTYRRNGLWQKAHHSYLKALDFSHAPTIQVTTANIYGAIADLNLQQGQLRKAAQSWKLALTATQEQESWGRYPLPLAGWIYIRTAELLYEWNQLDSAADHLAQGLERAVLGGDVRAQIAGTLLNARLSLAQGDSRNAGAMIEQAQRLLEQAQFPEWTARFERCRVDLWVAENKLPEAVKWCQTALERGAFEDDQESDTIHLAAARVLIVKAERDSLQQALDLLGAILEAAGSSGRSKTMIEALALHALAQWQLGDNAGALTSLERSLRLAEPEGYVRLFADLGLAMGRLLQEARSRGVMPQYVDSLLQGFGGQAAAPDAPGGPLPEPLTPREQEVLQLLAAGLTNREIAERFVISVETVKKHVGSIVGKLAASNRTEAVARARALGFLEQ